MSAPPEGKPTPGSPTGDATKVEISVQFQNEDPTVFRVKPTTKFMKIRKQLADRRGVDLQSFVLRLGDTRINDDDTPKMHEMEDGDLIEAHVHQIGGWRDK